jgi:hypothetical protein
VEPLAFAPGFPLSRRPEKGWQRVHEKWRENLAKQSVNAKSVRSPANASKAKREHRGNPDGLSDCYTVPENGTAAWIAMLLRSGEWHG